MKKNPMFLKHNLVATGLSLLASSLFSFAQGTSDLDSFLSSPVPSSPISEDLARQTVEKGDALAASNSARKEEIDAYLLPFKRVLPTQAAAKQDASQTSAVVAKPKPFIIFKSSDGTTEFFKAASMTTEGDIISVESPEGKKGMWDKSRYATQLPWYFDQELEGGNLDLETLALRYKVLQSTFPGVKTALQAEMDRILAVKHKLDEAAVQKKAAMKENAAQFISQAQSYSLEHPYTSGELAHTLLEAEQYRREVPEMASKLDRAMEPLRAHFENLLAGKVYFEGAWQPKALAEEVMARKKSEEGIRSFEKNLNLEVNAESLSQSEIHNLLTGFAILGVVIFILGLYLLLGKAALVVRVAGVLCCLAPATLWIVANMRLSAPYPSTPSFQFEKPEGISKVLRVLFLASSQGNAPVLESDHRITLREADLNSFLKDHVRFVSTPEQQKSSICRTDLAFQLLSEEVVVWELAQYKGRTLRIRYDLKTQGIGSALKIANSSVTIGNLALPKTLASKMVNRLSADLGKIFNVGAIQQAYKITRLTEGEADLTSIPKSEAGAAVTNSSPGAALDSANSDTSASTSYFGAAKMP